MAKRKKTRKTRKTGYTRERERIKRYINRYKKVGFESDLYIPTEKELRASGVKGAELAKLTRYLKRLTPSYLKENILYVPESEGDGYEWGEELGASWDDEKEEAIYIVDLFRRRLTYYSDQAGAQVLNDGLDRIIESKGIIRIAELVKKVISDGDEYEWREVYKGNAAKEYLNFLIDNLPDAGDVEQDDVRETLFDLLSMDYGD